MLTMIPFLLVRFCFWEKLEELDQRSLVLREGAMKNPKIKTKDDVILCLYFLKEPEENLLFLELHAILSGFMVLF